MIVIQFISSLKYSLLVQLYDNVTSWEWNFKQISRLSTVSTVYCQIATDCITDCHRYIGTEEDKTENPSALSVFTLN